MKFNIVNCNSSLYVSYNQISIFKKSLKDPFNDWEDEHVEQGFSWRKDSISFMSLKDNINVDVYVLFDDSTLYDDAIRIIELPFDCSMNNEIEIATITQSFNIILEKAFNRVICQLGKSKNKYWCVLSLIKDNKDKKYVNVIKADEEIKKKNKYLMKAKAAM